MVRHWSENHSERVFRAGVPLKYAFTRAHQAGFGVRAVCRVLRVHFSGFYVWLKETLSLRALEDARQTNLIRLAWSERGQVYGYGKLTDDLRDQGEQVSENRVARLATRAGHLRLRVYTDIPGQDALYLEKRAEALAYVASPQDPIVRDWNAQGRLIAVQAGPGLRSLWKADPAFAPKPVRASRSPEQNMWTAMRQMKSFSPMGLLANGATTEDVEVTLEMAQGYCRALMSAGYLAVARKAVPGKTEAIYRLTRNTGPRPPREKRVRAVIDDNDNAVVVIGGVQS
jgi:hypothetical protein